MTGPALKEAEGFWDEVAFQLRILDYRVQGDLPHHMPAGRTREIIEKAFRIIRDPITHRRYVQHLRGKLNSAPPSPEERSCSFVLFVNRRSSNIESDSPKEPGENLVPYISCIGNLSSRVWTLASDNDFWHGQYSIATWL